MGDPLHLYFWSIYLSKSENRGLLFEFICTNPIDFTPIDNLQYTLPVLIVDQHVVSKAFRSTPPKLYHQIQYQAV